MDDLEADVAAQRYLLIEDDDENFACPSTLYRIMRGVFGIAFFVWSVLLESFVIFLLDRANQGMYPFFSDSDRKLLLSLIVLSVPAISLSAIYAWYCDQSTMWTLLRRLSLLLITGHIVFFDYALVVLWEKAHPHANLTFTACNALCESARVMVKQFQALFFTLLALTVLLVLIVAVNVYPKSQRLFRRTVSAAQTSFPAPRSLPIIPTESEKS